MLQDFRFALRQLFKAPRFTLAAVAVLALGIGANTAIFSVVYTVVFRPPAYANPAQVVQLFSQDKTKPNSFRAFSYPTYRNIREQNTVFSDVLAHTLALVGIGEKGETRRAFAQVVTSNFFSVMGVAPALGRTFLPDEETLGKPAHVAIVSHRFWNKRGARPEILGSRVLINGTPFTVIGVMPPEFTGTIEILSPEVWLPMSVHDVVADDVLAGQTNALAERTSNRLLVVGRLKPGVTRAAADPALKALAANLEKTYPVEQKDQTFMTEPLSRFGAGSAPGGDEDVTKLGTLLLAMAAIVLLVASLNLANMLLARGIARRREIAIRLALGGSRSRVIRQLLIEGLALALLGGAVALLLGLWSVDLLIASFGALMPFDIVWESGPGPVMLAATFGFCVLGTLLFALGPALKLTKATALDDLKQQAGEDVMPRRWKFLPRNPLVAAQIALSLALLTAAMLFIRGAARAGSAATGLQTERTVLVEVDGSLGGYNPQQAQTAYRAVEERLAALPGVTHVSIAATVPFGMVSNTKWVRRGGVQSAADARAATAAEGRRFRASFYSVGADFFPTVGLPLLRGRAFTLAEATQAGGPPVAIVDELLAKKLWPDADPIGQRLQLARQQEEDGDAAASPERATGEIKPGESIEVVGVVPVIREAVFEKERGSAFYLPFSRGFQSNAFFCVRFASLPPGHEGATADLLRGAVRNVDPALPILSVKTFEQHLEGDLQLWVVRVSAAVFSVFGGVAFGLAIVGLYAVKAYLVARRTREIGIRMALGAQRTTVHWMILREGAVMLGTGLAIGLLLAVATAKIISALLYEVSATDPIAFTVAPILLAAAGLLATWLPARRATRISPMAALRTE